MITRGPSLAEKVHQGNVHAYQGLWEGSSGMAVALLLSSAREKRLASKGRVGECTLALWLAHGSRP